MKVIITTSDNYHKALRIFLHLFEKYWPEKVSIEIVGYKKPDFEIVNNNKVKSNFVSLGTQKTVHHFSDDLKPYFSQQDEFFIWFFDDSFIIKRVDLDLLNIAKHLMIIPGVVKINLTNESYVQIHSLLYKQKEYKILETSPFAKYRLSTQPSIWRRDFLINNLKTGLSPWAFEKQNCYDYGRILGLNENIVQVGEGMRKGNDNVMTDFLYDSDVQELSKLGLI